MKKANKIEVETYESGRIVSLSDGIFSVATTLCVLEVLPSDLNERILSVGTRVVLLDMYPKLLGVVFTFFIVSIYWLGHQRIFSFVKKTDKSFLHLNLFFLMLISLMPFAIKISGAHSHDRESAIFYSFFMASVGFCLHFMWRYASGRHRLIEAAVPKDVVFLNLLRTAVPAAIFFISGIISYFDPVSGRYFWLALIFNRKITETLFYLLQKAH